MAERDRNSAPPPAEGENAAGDGRRDGAPAVSAPATGAAAAAESAVTSLAPDAIVAEPSPRQRFFERLTAARRLVRAEVVFLGGLAVFAVLALFARAYAYFSWDLETARAVQGLGLPGMPRLMYWVSRFGDSWRPWALSGAAILGFLLRRRRTEASALLLCVAGGSLVNRIFKMTIDRPRPAEPLVRVSREWAHESFPSGHVAFYVCFFGFMLFASYALLPRGSRRRRLAVAAAAIPIVLIGLSRVYLGAHWPSDTLGAYLLSGLWLALCVHLYQRWKARSTFHAGEQAGGTTGTS